MVGSDYQAQIPDMSSYDDAMPYENEDKLLWDPGNIPEKDVRDYLLDIQTHQINSAEGVDLIPRGPHVRDDEQVRTSSTRNSLLTQFHIRYLLFLTFDISIYCTVLVSPSSMRT